MKIFLLLAALLFTLPAGEVRAEMLSPSVLVSDKGCDAQGNTTFELSAQKDVLLQFYTVAMREDGTLYEDVCRQHVVLRKGEGCRLTMLVSETMPNLMVCANHSCWAPAYSGMDGSLILADGFAAGSDPKTDFNTVADFSIR